MAIAHLKLVAPTTKNRTVTPHRRPNRELRTREHLTTDEVARLMEAAKTNRNGHRDATMNVRRVKSGTPGTHPLTGRELRALRRLQRDSAASPFVFVSERGAPFSTAGFGRMIERAAMVASLDIKVHAHMLRHACGFALANAGHDTRSLQAYLGHKNIQHTVRYTELSPTRFRDFWKD